MKQARAKLRRRCKQVQESLVRGREREGRITFILSELHELPLKARQ